ncbi:alpha/beta fold hydrolase [Microbacterium sp.]|uniref:alpha/beta fold hydrolase n=1 Tax=Microbacterium sp. TaxID=51671 RepID=UPI002CE9C806|nr:alpha/beta fold hydrolase [Microbacterium sp.]HWK76306.1 alpha/beta fold hydrolase [Microbacterium sp.]
MTQRALLVHGFASSFEATWAEAGWPEFLADIDIETVSFELPGHGSSPLAGDTAREDVVQALLDAGRDADLAIGFSAGSALLLHAAIHAPDAFARLALLGIGDGMWPADGTGKALSARLLGEDDDETTRLLRSMAASAGNRLEAIAAYARTSLGPPALTELSGLAAPVLIVLGERDTVGPTDAIISALPRASATTLPRVDHYRTPDAPAAMSAVMDFVAG